LLGALVSQGGTERTDPVDGRTGPLLRPRGVALGLVPLALGPDESVLGLGQPAPGECQILSQTQVGAGGVLLRLETVLPVGGLVGAVVADGAVTNGAFVGCHRFLLSARMRSRMLRSASSRSKSARARSSVTESTIWWSVAVGSSLGLRGPVDRVSEVVVHAV